MGEDTTGSPFPTIGNRKWACAPARAVFDSRLKPAHLRTLLALGLHTNPKGRCHVKAATLAAIVGTHVQNVRRYLRELEKFGYLTRSEMTWRNGGRRENAYELVLGGEYPATQGACVVGDSPHEERVTRTRTTPALAGPGEDDMGIHTEADACNDGLDRPTRQKPKAKKKTGHPEKSNAHTVGQYFVALARSHQFGHAGAATLGQMTGTFRRWHHDDGVSYREILRAIDLFFDQLPPDLEAPAGRVFIKQGFDWIAQAKVDIYRQELPKIQEVNVEMWERIYADLDAWVAANPGATDEERSAMKAALFQQWKREPKYAVAYA